MIISENFKSSRMEIINTINAQLNETAGWMNTEVATSALQRKDWGTKEDWCGAWISVKFTRNGEEVSPFEGWTSIHYQTVMSGFWYSISTMDGIHFTREYSGKFNGLRAQSHIIEVFVPQLENSIARTSLAPYPLTGKEITSIYKEMPTEGKGEYFAQVAKRYEIMDEDTMRVYLGIAI